MEYWMRFKHIRSHQTLPHIKWYAFINDVSQENQKTKHRINATSATFCSNKCRKEIEMGSVMAKICFFSWCHAAMTTFRYRTSVEMLRILRILPALFLWCKNAIILVFMFDRSNYRNWKASHRVTNSQTLKHFLIWYVVSWLQNIKQQNRIEKNNQNHSHIDEFEYWFYIIS